MRRPKLSTRKLSAWKKKKIQGVQLKSVPYFNMSNLITKIYNMLYYTTNMYLQLVLEMMSIHFNVLALLLALVCRDQRIHHKLNFYL